jgi:hypothetical protein
MPADKISCTDNRQNIKQYQRKPFMAIQFIHGRIESEQRPVRSRSSFWKRSGDLTIASAWLGTESQLLRARHKLRSSSFRGKWTPYIKVTHNEDLRHGWYAECSAEAYS